jgi:hypothetical protein
MGALHCLAERAAMRVQPWDHRADLARKRRVPDNCVSIRFRFSLLPDSAS